MQRVHLSDFSVSSEILLDAQSFAAPKCLVHTNFLSVNEDAGQKHLRGLYIARERKVPAVALHVLPSDTRLVVPSGEEFLPVTGDRVLDEQVNPGWSKSDIETAVGTSAGTDGLPGDAVLIARYGVRTWGHWLGELLPKLVCVEACYPGRFRYVLPDAAIHDPSLRTLRQSLVAYGITQERLILLPPRRSYRFGRLLLPSPVWSADRAIHPGAVELMRRVIASLPAFKDMPTSVALLRRESRTRNLANVAEAADFFEQRGWPVLEISNLEFSDQVRVFAAATNIAGVLGSGLTGLIYSPPGVNVLTLAPAKWGDLFFFAMMQNRDARLADIRGRSLADDDREAFRASFHVALADIGAGLRALGVEPLAEKPVRLDWMTDPVLALCERAHRLRDAGQADEAERSLRAALVLDAQDAAAMGGLVGLLLASDRVDEALAAAEPALAGNPDIGLLRSLQDHLRRLGKIEEAVAYARRETNAAPYDAELFSRLGHLLGRAGAHSEAAEAFARAIALRPDDFGP